MVESWRTRRQEGLDRATGTIVTCGRCQGLLILTDTVEQDTVWTGSRCPICGDRIDRVILQHRRMWPPPEPAREHVLPVYRPKRRSWLYDRVFYSISPLVLWMPSLSPQFKRF
jgi:hypothetical protein